MKRGTAKQWPVVPLGSIAEFKNGVNYTSQSFGRGIKVINVKDFQNRSTVNSEDLDEINPAGVVRGKDLLREGDVVFVRSNGNRALIGRSLLITKCSENITHSAFSIRARFTSDAVIPKFYAYLFRSVLIREALSAYGSGTNISNLNQAILTELPVPLPCLEDQHNVVGFLTAYDDLIENNTRRIQILERMAQAIYREWFVNFRFPGHEKVKFVDSPLGKIPQGWLVRRLDEVAAVNTLTVRRGQEPEQILYVDISSVATGRIEKIESMAFVDSPGRARRIVRHGDTIWSCVRPNRKSFSLILSPPADLIVSTGFAVLTPTNVPFSFLHQAVTTDDFIGYLTNHATGAAYPAVTAKDFESAKLVIPDERLLGRSHENCEPLLVLKENLLRKNANLRRTRDLLLPKLISGALDTSNLNIELT